MIVPFYFVLGYIIIINVVTCVLYVKEAKAPSPRIAALILIVLPIIGGSFGAVLANYFCNTEFKELRSWLSKFIGYLPSIMFIIHFVLFVSGVGISNCLVIVWDHVYASAGIIGCILVVVNFISFVLVVIRRSAYYMAPHGNFLIPDFVLIPILILGGATGGMLAKIVFNFKENWSCNATMRLQNFIYNKGMFLIGTIHIGLYLGFTYFG